MEECTATLSVPGKRSLQTTLGAADALRMSSAAMSSTMGNFLYFIYLVHARYMRVSRSYGYAQ